MRIAHITAGAGQMYCGSCLRDNVLASALLDAGHEVLLIPTYTPTRAEGRDVSLDRVYMGGINVFLQEHVPLFRRTPAVPHTVARRRTDPAAGDAAAASASIRTSWAA